MTEFIYISRKRDKFDVHMEDELHQENSYKYLGIVVNEENKQETELNSRIEKYTRNFMMIFPLLKESVSQSKLRQSYTTQY